MPCNLVCLRLDIVLPFALNGSTQGLVNILVDLSAVEFLPGSASRQPGSKDLCPLQIDCDCRMIQVHISQVELRQHTRMITCRFPGPWYGHVIDRVFPVIRGGPCSDRALVDITRDWEAKLKFIKEVSQQGRPT